MHLALRKPSTQRTTPPWPAAISKVAKSAVPFMCAAVAIVAGASRSKRKRAKTSAAASSSTSSSLSSSKPLNKKTKSEAQDDYASFKKRYFPQGLQGDNSKLVEALKATPGCEAQMETLNQFAEDYPDSNPFVHGVACTNKFDLDVDKVVIWLMNFPPDTVGPSGGYGLNGDGTCIKNASIRTLVETLPLYMAIAGVICVEFAFLLTYEPKRCH